MKLTFLHKKESTPVAQYLPREGQSWFDTYFTALKHALMRAWNWKFLWLWGILLPAGGGGLNMGGGDWGTEEESWNPTMGSSPEIFVQEYVMWIVLGIVVALAVMFIFWILGNIARWGLVQVLSELQDIGRPVSQKISLVWHRGKRGVWRVFLLDFLVIAIYLVVLLTIAVIVAATVFATDNAGLLLLFFIPMGIIVFFLFIFFTIVLRYVVSSAVVIMALENGRVLSSVKKAWHLVRYNIREVLKLMITRIVLGIGSSVAFFAMMIVVVLCGAFIFGVIFGLGALLDSINHAALLIPAVGFGILFGAFFLVIMLVFNAIISLMTHDLWVWWVKRLTSQSHEEQ